MIAFCEMGAAAAGAVALGSLVAGPAGAAVLTGAGNLPAPAGNFAPEVPSPESLAPDGLAPEGFAGAAPDGTPAEEAYWVWRNGRRIWIQPRRRRVCRNVRVRGGWVRRCWWQ
ncbi:hypothetical protein NVS89_08205 [Ancylobacter sp. MQZ15Z-1]|uniref:Uncharacterized protein n=1 Tax=Ancylobacter mangrovi TaxID=2972472 RepID=A0A9X2PGL3_9HYPH|nr:hypothetical protein [Ancylobacter mangrovi]MCS0495077.1 hypothetical protein [Ancylobacter mangrovi]